jgi:hypothetical protein
LIRTFSWWPQSPVTFFSYLNLAWNQRLGG